jgi:hypothetical protein
MDVSLVAASLFAVSGGGGGGALAAERRAESLLKMPPDFCG